MTFSFNELLYSFKKYIYIALWGKIDHILLVLPLKEVRYGSSTTFPHPILIFELDIGLMAMTTLKIMKIGTSMGFDIF